MADNQALASKERSESTPYEHTRGGMHFTPRVDIYETDHELVLQTDMPGVGPEDVDLRYEQGELRLYGKVLNRQRSGHPLVQEYDEGDFLRTFTIHESIDAARIEAECKNGVLTVHLPKVPTAKPKQIAVKGAT
jgi:HSP20 family protein